MVPTKKFKPYASKESFNPITVKEAEALGGSLLSLRDLARSDHKLHDKLVNRSHDLAEKDIQLFNNYVKSCTYFCNGNVLSELLTEIQYNLNIELMSSSLRCEKAQGIINLINEFKKNLQANGHEGKFDALHESITETVKRTQTSYHYISCILDVTPQAFVPKGNLQEGIDNIRSERHKINNGVFVPMMKAQDTFWANIKRELNDAVVDNLNDPTDLLYRRKF